MLERFKQALIISMQISDRLRKIRFGKRHFKKKKKNQQVKDMSSTNLNVQKTRIHALYSPVLKLGLYIFRFKGFKAKLTNK